MEEPRWATDDLVVQSSDMALMNVASLANSGALDLSPRFQRRNRWDTDRQSLLIESFLMNVPVPPVYLAEEQHGRFSVIDGKQRLTAISRFLNGEFRLTNLKFQEDLSGRTFNDLPPSLAGSLNLRPLRAVIIMRQTADWVKYEVFIRLNTGGQPLNPQEVRNVAFAGPLNDALIDLSENKFLRRQLKIRNANSATYAEMGDVEYVLRFFTLAETWQGFGGNLRPALDDFMLRHHNDSSATVLKLRKRFERATDACEQIWGNSAFKRYDHGQWRDQMIGAVYDAQMIACDLATDAELSVALAHPNRALRRMAALFEQPEFESAIRTSTNTATRVRLRIEYVYDLLLNLATR
jgi:hypothetical protein